MAELINGDKIRSELTPVLSQLVDDTIGVIAETRCKLESVVLYGSVVSGGFRPGKSDVNVLMVFDKINIALLGALRGTFNRHFKKLRARPVVLDEDFMENSTDVFPMEFLEWKERSLVIFGGDPLADVDVSRANLRLRVEENLRGKRLRLIQSYFEMDPRRKQLQPFLENTIPNFLTVFRNILRMIGTTPPDDTVELIGAVETGTSVELTSIRRLQQLKNDSIKLKQKELDVLFRDYLVELQSLVEYVDSFETAPVKGNSNPNEANA